MIIRIEALFFAALLLIANNAFASEALKQHGYKPLLFEIPVKPLNSVEVENLRQYRGKPLLLSFFTANCPWCEKQHQVLEQIQQQCAHIQPIMFGIGKQKQPLKKVMRRLKSNFPSYLAPSGLTNALGSQVTPRLLVVNEQGEFTHNLVGYLPLKKLADAVQFTQFNCELV